MSHESVQLGQDWARLVGGLAGNVGASVDEVYAEAKRQGYEIVHPLTKEAWGVRRFFVRAPDGNVINMVSHFLREHPGHVLDSWPLPAD